VTSTRTQTTAAPWTVDADRWPDVAVAAGSRARAAIARAVFTTAAARLPLRVKLPDGRLVGTGGPAAPVMVLRHPREFFRRFGASGLIGFGESYMAGDWDSADLTGLLAVFAAHADELVPTWLSDCARWPSAASRRTTGRPSRARGATSAATTTCPTTCSRCSSTRP
jgi:cyclopropane-fatty-acyl-phospholipid synthase